MKPCGKQSKHSVKENELPHDAASKRIHKFSTTFPER